MKTSIVSKVLAVAAAILLFGSSHAQVLLTVQWNPSTNVLTFSATGSTPTANATIGSYDGITLDQFFTSTWAGDTLNGAVTLSSTLSDGSGNYQLNSIWVDTNEFLSGYRNLGLYRSPNNSDQLNFSTAATAFTGATSFDLGSVSGVIYGDPYTFNSFMATAGRSIGTTGDLFAGYSGSVGGPILIGSWQMVAVPEPSTYALLVGVAVLAFAMWRRRAAASSAKT